MNVLEQKENDQSAGSVSVSASLIKRIKMELRNWYGNLSVKELACNTSLVAEIEKIEKLLAGQVVAL